MKGHHDDDTPARAEAVSDGGSDGSPLRRAEERLVDGRRLLLYYRPQDAR